MKCAVCISRNATRPDGKRVPVNWLDEAVTQVAGHSVCGQHIDHAFEFRAIHQHWLLEQANAAKGVLTPPMVNNLTGEQI